MLMRSLLLACLLMPAAAFADRIDGEWCSADGTLHVKIDGPSIVTPGGHRITGQYDRHAFAFTVPEGEANAGAEVDMRLLSETAVAVRYGAQPVETWNRCKPIA